MNFEDGEFEVIGLLYWIESYKIVFLKDISESFVEVLLLYDISFGIYDWVHPCRLKVPTGDELPRNRHRSMRYLLLLLLISFSHSAQRHRQMTV